MSNSTSSELTADSTENFSQLMQRAETLLREGQVTPALGLLEQALPLAPSAEHAARVQEILAMLQETTAAGEAAAQAAAPTGDDFFGPNELEHIERAIAAYTADPAGAGRREPVAGLQQGLLDFLGGADLEKLEALFRGDFGQVYRALLQSGLSTEAPTPEMQTALDELDATLLAEDGFDLRLLLVRMLCAPAHRGALMISPDKVPAWWLEDYLGYVLHAPQVFVLPGEAEQYHAHLLGWMRAVRSRTLAAPDASLTVTVAGHFARKVSFIPAYFSDGNLRELAELRATILEFFLRKKGAAFDARLTRRPNDRRRIKVGFINAHFGAQTETHVTLPTLQLDRAKFEVCLFAVGRNPGPVEDYCRRQADSLTVLPEGLNQQVKLLRDAALDIAIIGTNVTAVTNQVALIAVHRLAPVQLASYCSPISTGMRSIDGYLSGTFTDRPGLQEHFSEKLYLCDGPPGCLDYSVEAEARTGVYDRARLGLAPDDVVFLNAAACFKILPEMQETWAKILAAVPRSKLVLLPFNPNWTSNFPVKQFDRTLTEILARHGIARSRVVLVDSLPTRADVKALERVADVYLDTAPFSGSISVIDPLEVGLPTVIRQGSTHRGRMAAALVRELGIPELIAGTEDDYHALAVKLGTDLAFRRQLQGRILAAMARRPKFINAPAYAAGLSRLLESLVAPANPAARSAA